jgi:hypothetical protein
MKEFFRRYIHSRCQRGQKCQGSQFSTGELTKQRMSRGDLTAWRSGHGCESLCPIVGKCIAPVRDERTNYLDSQFGELYRNSGPTYPTLVEAIVVSQTSSVACLHYRSPYFFVCQSNRAVHSKASGSTICTIHGSSEPLTVLEPFIIFELIGFLLTAALSQY